MPRPIDKDGNYRDWNGHTVHPNSLQARASSDPELRKRIDNGRIRCLGDLKAMEAWHRMGCQPTVRV
jgi:hypothetical protein